jgi:uncharacterized protein (DUF1501 family)
MKRRDLLKSMLMLPLAGGSAKLYAQNAMSAANSAAQTTSGPRLLVVFLRGGYDAANLLVPISSSYYYEARPNIAVPKPAVEQTSAALPIDADWGLHPALRDTIYPLFQKKQAAFIPFAGIHDLSRSHFETQDSIELGQPLGKSRDYDSGFMNRLAGVVNGGSPIAMTDQLPIICRGSLRVPNMALKSLAKPGVDPRQSAIIASMYQQSPLAGAVKEGFAVREGVLREMASEMEMADRNAISAKGFELEARRIAKLMRENYNIGFVDVGGWDTHVGQGGATGTLATRFEELGRGLAGFVDGIGPQWKDTVVVVVSEFGRTFKENGNRGTDHGHGSVYWVLGGGINGGRVAGEQIRIAKNTLHQERDYPVLNEYRSVFGGLFERMYGLRAPQLSQIFADTRAVDLKLI